MLSDETLQNLTGLTRDQFYDFRNRYVMLQGRIFKVTPDAAALIVLLKMHKDDTYRELAAIFNVSGCNSDKIFWKVMEVIFLDNILPQRWDFQNRMSLNFYFDLLATKTQQHPRELEIYRHLCGQGQRLIVAVGDSTKFRLVKSSDHKLQRQTYLSRLHTNVATKMEIVDLDGDTILFFPLLASADPVLGDANIMVCQAELEENNQITGGLMRFVTGLPGFVICLILDKGFLVHRFNPCNQTLMQFFNTVANNNNNCLRAFCPLNPGDTYLDNNLLPAGNDPLNLVINNVQRRRARRLTDLEANTARVAVAMSRWIVEASYAADRAISITGKKKAIPHQYLEKAGFAPSPDSSKLAIILYAAIVLKNRYHEPYELKFTLPPQVTYADLGTRAAERILFRNLLDPINHVQWLVNDLSARRAANQPWQPINLMQTNATGMAFIPREHLTEISLGPYTVNLMYGYITSIQVNEVMSQQQYGSLDQYNAACKQPPRFVQAYYFDQVAPPVN